MSKTEESFPLTKHSYSDISTFEGGNEDSVNYISKGPSRLCRLLPWILHATLIAAYSLAFLLLSSISTPHLKLDSREKQEIYSPMWDAVEYETHQFQASPWTKTPYRGTPSPEIDKAWEEIIPLYLIKVPPSAIPQLNKSTTAATFPGSKDYLGTIDAFHQLHCVNLVRKYTYQDYYKDRDLTWSDPPDMVRLHVDHCIDLLRQKIMCDADVSVVTYSWVEGREHVLPDFSNTHRCRNFGKVRDWVLANRVNMASREITKSMEAVSIPTW